MEIPSDTKDWTWVLDRECAECGFDAGAVPPGNVAGLIRENARIWVELLKGADGLRSRPSPLTWSPLEYACHVRDIFRLFDHRLELMLIQDDPLYPNWDQDATAVEERYAEQDPAVVAVELAQAAEGLAARFSEVGETQWDRPGRRSDGARFTVISFARYLIHDPVHHLYDVSGLQARHQSQ